MAGDLHIRVCETRQQKSARRQDARCDSRTSYADGRETANKTEVKVAGRWYSFNFWLERAEHIPYTHCRTREERLHFADDRYSGPFEWIGSLSRMSVVTGATLDEGIPQVVQKVMAAFEGRVLTVISPQLIADVAAAFETSVPHPYYGQAQKEDVLAFLRAHQGKMAYAD
ncbi:hypothetical protein F6X40_23985 [Paraburkholderia sp. UCT31]|uniref:hypothetical protein n=1 Tax=Paraburkholderia sp. UCT31 TaxID=2615209 RepID=UPI0016557761|nr:hypothetical protein [Paraburkholderia sp. UCT31]MBC8739777.1 hypothetical protein [Paraburkholderia sp. UCT31]